MNRPLSISEFLGFLSFQDGGVLKILIIQCFYASDGVPSKNHTKNLHLANGPVKTQPHFPLPP